MHSLDARSSQRQQALRDEIADQIAEFLAKGGEIEQLQEPKFGLQKTANADLDSDLLEDGFQ